MKRNLSWTLIGNLSFAFIKWVTLIMIVRSLTSFDVGVYTLSLAITAPIFLFSNMRLRLMFVVSKKENYKDYMYLRITLMLVSIIIVYILATIFYSDFLSILLLVGLIKSLELLSDIFFSLAHKKNNLSLVGKLLFFKSIGIGLANIIILYYYDSLQMLLISHVIFLSIYLLIEYLLCKKHLPKTTFNFKLSKAVLLTGLPLGFVQLLSSLNASLPKYFLDIFYEVELVGYFTSIVYLLTIADLMMNSIAQNFVVKIKNLIINNNYELLKDFIIKKLSVFVSFIGFIIILSSFLIGDKILLLIYGTEYTQFHSILVLLSIAIFFNFLSWISDTVLMAFQYYRIQPFIAIFIFTLGLPIAFILINKFDLIGATIVLIIINIFQALLKSCACWYVFRKRRSLNENSIFS